MANTENRMEQGGSTWTIAGDLDMIDGARVLNDGTQAEAIADVATAGSATAATNATAINAILAALRGAGIIAAS